MLLGTQALLQRTLVPPLEISGTSTMRRTRRKRRIFTWGKNGTCEQHRRILGIYRGSVLKQLPVRRTGRGLMARRRLGYADEEKN